MWRSKYNHKSWSFFLFLFLTLRGYYVKSYHLIDHHEKIYFLKPGDIMLGGIFTLHWSDMDTYNCTQIRPLREIFRVEAMAYAVEKVNQRKDMLPGLQLGFQILDDCGTEQSSLAAVLHFVPGDIHQIPHDGCMCPDIERRTNIVGIIGPPLSTNAIPTSKLLNLFHMPQISHAATSDELSNKIVHPYFLRTVPPESQRAQAIVDLLLHFNWTYVFTINSAESYGRNGINKFIVAASGSICVADRLEVSELLTDEGFDKVVEKMVNNSNARVVVLFSLTREADLLFSALKRAKVERSFTFITTDREALDLGQGGHAGAVAGGLFVGSVKAEVEGLNDHLRSLLPEHHMENPWFPEYYDQYMNCTHRNSTCNADFHLQESQTYSLGVVDAVFAYASALDEMRKDLCPGNQTCDKLKEAARDGDQLLRYLHNNMFIGGTGETRFDSHGDVMAKFALFALQFENDKYELINVGKVDIVTGTVSIEQPINWNTGEVPPISRCGKSCGDGQAVAFRQDGCCWDCWTCSDNEIVDSNNSRCEKCQDGFWPDRDFTTCERITPTSIRWSDGVAICLLTLATIGEFITIFVGVFYIRHFRHLVIKASSRELSSILLFGVLLSFIMIYGFITTPSPNSCLLNRIGFMLCFTIIYAPILSRANRIYRIFSAAKKSTKPPPMISPCSQMAQTLILISIQVIINLVWIFLVPPVPVEVMPIPTERKVELYCNITEAEVITSVAYNLLLLVLCCICAFKTRRVPDNYNESRHIAWTVYTVLVIWCAFIPTYFAINDAVTKVTILSMAVLVNAWVNLVFMFFPKLLAVQRTESVAV
ncbi:metabotropic glutamate receptor 3-like [Glandiceps talaboti]